MLVTRSHSGQLCGTTTLVANAIPMHHGAMRIDKRTVVTRSKDLFHRTTMKADIAVRHYEVTPAGRKRKALNNLGIQVLVDVGANKGQAAALYRRHGFRG